MSYMRGRLRGRSWFSFIVGLWVIAIVVLAVHVRAGAPLQTAAFQAIVLKPSLPEAPFNLRFFSGAVKTDSRGEIITGFSSDPVKRLVGAESAGERAGVERFTKIMFGVNYFDGRPDPGTRLDPNNQQVNSGNQHWPFVPQPFRSWPNALARDARRREALRHAAGARGLSGLARRVGRHRHAARAALDRLSVAGQPRGTRPVGIAVSPPNTAIYPRPYAVVAQQVRELRQRHRHRQRRGARSVRDRLLRRGARLQRRRARAST